MIRTMFRGLVIGLLATALIVPAGEFTALARAQKDQKDQKKEQQPPPSQQPQVSISVDVPLVSVDVVATDNSGNFITGLRKENFRILEDGVPQTITNFSPTDAPLTTVMLMEFSKLGFEIFAYNATQWGQVFLNQLKKDDWIALVSFDLKTRIEADFTKDKFQVGQILSRMYFPGFSEANVFDALLDTLDRLQDVKGKKSILLLASGFDTFSKHTLDDVLKRLRQTDTSIFCVGVGRDLIEYLDAQGYIGPLQRVGYQQAENQMNAFARLTGGIAYFPRFEGEIPGIMREVATALRNQYSLGYSPASAARDGKFHKIKVEIVNPDGTPLALTDQKGKKVKIVVYAREGYTAPKGAVGD